MSQLLLVPLLVALAATASSGMSQRYLRPRVAAWSLVVGATVTALAAVSALVMVLVEFVHAAAQTQGALAWCLHLDHHGPVPWVEGSIAAAWLAGAAVRVARCSARYRGLVPEAGSGGVEIVDDESPVAYTLPGGEGRTVVSSGMLRALSSNERAVLFSHERSHRARRHDRFILAVDLAVAVVPLLGPMRAYVRYATERWADEDAAQAVGDRRLVARALARAALVQHAARQPGMAMADLGVRTRVDQLLAEPTRRSIITLTAAGSAGLTALATVSASVQMHHLAMVTAHLCA